uniref:Uncharacterized protein n=1 Tax=Timema genevievae TaxID=629358 RepID=A0A7R9K8R4_TIMGE|nr:unnamed protein product [Timema genevievae]
MYDITYQLQKKTYFWYKKLIKKPHIHGNIWNRRYSNLIQPKHNSTYYITLPFIITYPLIEPLVNIDIFDEITIEIKIRYVIPKLYNVKHYKNIQN